MVPIVKPTPHGYHPIIWPFLALSGSRGRHHRYLPQLPPSRPPAPRQPGHRVEERPGSNAPSLGCRSRNQRNSRSVSIRSPNWRSLRIEYRAMTGRALSSCSGGTLSRPVRPYAAVILGAHRGQDGVHLPLHLPPRVVESNAVFDRGDVEQGRLVDPATHDGSRRLVRVSRPTPLTTAFFSTLLDPVTRSNLVARARQDRGGARPAGRGLERCRTTRTTQRPVGGIHGREPAKSGQRYGAEHNPPGRSAPDAPGLPGLAPLLTPPPPSSH